MKVYIVFGLVAGKASVWQVRKTMEEAEAEVAFLREYDNLFATEVWIEVHEVL